MLQSICLKYLTPSLYIPNPLMKPFAAVDIFDSFPMLMAHNGFSMRHYHFFFNHLNSTVYVNSYCFDRATTTKTVHSIPIKKKFCNHILLTLNHHTTKIMYLQADKITIRFCVYLEWNDS